MRVFLILKLAQNEIFLVFTRARLSTSHGLTNEKFVNELFLLRELDLAANSLQDKAVASSGHLLNGAFYLLFLLQIVLNHGPIFDLDGDLLLARGLRWLLGTEESLFLREQMRTFEEGNALPLHDVVNHGCVTTLAAL